LSTRQRRHPCSDTTSMSKYDWPRHGNDPGPSAQGGSPPDFSGAASEDAARPSSAPTDGPEAGSDPRPRTVDQALDLVDQLREQLAAKEAEVATAKDQLLRERAELENFKRRMQRERSEALRYASEHLLRDLLPVVDNLERALEHARVDGNGRSIIEGVELVLKGLVDVLQRHGVTKLDAAGTTFDPTHHEAVAHVETAELEPNRVLEQHQPGYVLNERLLRPALVSVSKAPSGDAKLAKDKARG